MVQSIESRRAKLTVVLLASFVAALVGLFAASVVMALEPPRAGEFAALRAKGEVDAATERARALGNDQFAPDIVERMSRIRSQLTTTGSPLPPAPQSAPGDALYGSMSRLGVVKVPVVIIDFWDYPAQVTPAQVQQMMGGDGFEGNAPTESLRNYYLRSSYNALDIQPEVLGIYHYPGNRSEISTTSYSAEMTLVKDAFTHFDQQGHDFSEYDPNGDGTMDYEVVFWTGPAGDWASFWWGHFGVSGDETKFDGKRLGSWSWQWAPVPDGLSASVVIHETGHALGLPDLYDYDDGVGTPGGVWIWDPMQSNTGDHNAFSKWMLGWLTPGIVSEGSQLVSLRPAGTYPDATIVMPRYTTDDPLKEFFLVEARNTSGNDATWFYPASTALQVWHFDAGPGSRIWSGGFRFNNSFTSHKFARVMEADGQEHIELGLPHTDDWWTDLFQPGQTFGASTVPSSTPYYGTSSGVSITGIERVGSDLTFVASILDYDYDFTPPVSVSNISSGWSSENVTVSVGASDASPYSSCMVIPAWNNAAFDGNELLMTNEGAMEVQFWSVDYAGNVEPTQSATVRIDKTPPALELDAEGTYADAATIRTVTSDAVSGLDRVEMKLDSGEWIRSDEITTTEIGSHTVQARAFDVAGNRREVEASFEVVPSTYALTYTAGTGGRILGSTTQTVERGHNGTEVIAASDPGYHFVGWSDLILTASRIETNVTADKNVDAMFAADTYTLTPSPGANGSISPNSPQTVNSGASITFTITPASGYQVADVLVDGTTVGPVASHTFSNVTSDHTISATFSAVELIPVTSLLVVPGPSAGSALLTWTNPPAPFFKARVLRKIGTVPSINPNDGDMIYEGPFPTYTDIGLTLGTTYIYSVFAANDASPTVWSAPASATYTPGGGTDTPMPVWRFRNKKLAGTYLWTASAAERNNINATMGSTWQEEGVAFEINTANPLNKDPLWRFLKTTTWTYFFTATEAEKNNTIANLSSMWGYEGAAFSISLTPQTDDHLALPQREHQHVPLHR